MCVMTLIRSLKTFRLLQSFRDYGTFRWNNRDIFVLPTPGHTLGSVSLITDIDGKKTAFTGYLTYITWKPGL